MPSIYRNPVIWEIIAKIDHEVGADLTFAYVYAIRDTYYSRQWSSKEQFIRHMIKVIKNTENR